MFTILLTATIINIINSDKNGVDPKKKKKTVVVGG